MYLISGADDAPTTKKHPQLYAKQVELYNRVILERKAKQSKSLGKQYFPVRDHAERNVVKKKSRVRGEDRQVGFIQDCKPPNELA